MCKLNDNCQNLGEKPTKTQNGPLKNFFFLIHNLKKNQPNRIKLPQMSKKFPNNPNLCLGYQPPLADNQLPAMASHCLG